MSEHHVLGLSGGKDSAALAVYMRLHHPELDIKYFFTDTGKELPEVYEFLGRLEGFLGSPINYLNPHRDFDFWLRQYGHFLPSASTRWCTRKLKLEPFKNWIKPWLAAGDSVHSYVAIRSDEDHREGMVAQHENLSVHMPFREAGVDKLGVLEILEGSGLGLPKYYDWRSRSGCSTAGRRGWSRCRGRATSRCTWRGPTGRGRRPCSCACARIAAARRAWTRSCPT